MNRALSEPPEAKEAAEEAVNPVLREQLTALREQPGWSNNQIAKRLGCNPSYVSQYISKGLCPGDLSSFERKVVDFLQNETRRRASGVETAVCNASGQVKTALEYIRKTNDVGAILGESGEGKTRGEELYIADNPTAIFYRTTVWSADKQSVESAMFELVGRAGYDGRTKRAFFIVDKMRGSDRLVIVDDAHKLTRPALQWWFDFHDATLCPVAFVGTYALLDKLEDDTQRFSRTGMQYEIKSQDDKGNLIVDRPLIKHLIKQLVPDCNGELTDLADLCEQVASNHGHYRSVHKQLKLSVEIKGGKTSLAWCKAFRSAHTMLVRNYKLA